MGHRVACGRNCAIRPAAGFWPSSICTMTPYCRFVRSRSRSGGFLQAGATSSNGQAPRTPPPTSARTEREVSYGARCGWDRLFRSLSRRFLPPSNLTLWPHPFRCSFFGSPRRKSLGRWPANAAKMRNRLPRMTGASCGAWRGGPGSSSRPSLARKTIGSPRTTTRALRMQKSRSARHRRISAC